MTFADLLSGLDQVKLKEKRVQSDHYCEVVVPTAELSNLTLLLEQYFGAPLKRKDDKPSRESDAYSAPHGGVRSGQTLYVRKGPDKTDLVLLWPWGDGISVTVKLIRT